MSNLENETAKGERVVDFLKHIADLFELEIEYQLKENEKKIEVLLEGKDAKTFVGFRGEAMNSLQYLANILINRDSDDFVKVYIDSEDFRKKREQSLKNLAQKLANKAVKTNQKVKLESMTAQERRIIHAELHSSTEVDTMSYGNEPNRYIIITPKNFQESKKPFTKDSKLGKNRNFGEKKKSGNKPVTPTKPTSAFGFGSFLGNSKNLSESEYEKKKAAFFSSKENKFKE